MIEVWKDIPGYEGIYQVSTFGRIKSLGRILLDKNNVSYNKKEKILKERSARKYKTIALYKNKKRNDFLIHRIVAQAFIPNPENKKEVNHIDGCCSNNKINNLEWVTPQENVLHATYITKTNKFPFENYCQKIPVVQLDKNLNFINSFDSITDAHKHTGINNSHIGSCCKGNLKSAGGFIWKCKKDWRMYD